MLMRKRERGDWSDSSTDSAPDTAYHEQSKLVGKIQSTILSPESPPEYEKGLSNLDYVPKSPVYYPAGYSDVSDQDSLIDLTDEDLEENHSARSQKSPSQPEKETTLKSPSAEEKTEQNPSPKPEAYQPGDKIGNINLESDEQIFNKLSKIARFCESSG